MIGKITGIVDYVADDHALIEAAGVGYIVFCTASTLRGLPGPGQHAALYTELVVREDLMQLFGFPTRLEREWHRLLVSVQGVGSKVSLGILGALGPAGIGRALAIGDATAVRSAPGVGPKLATRIVTELKGKAPEILSLGGHASLPATPPVVGGDPAPDQAGTVRQAPPPPADDRVVHEAEAVSALINLGYDRGEAAAAAAVAEGSSTAELIRAALKSLGQNL
ncbi:MAG: Holliday junction branch migration protein RuvA [Pseudomonadota bacterium]